MTTRRLHFTAMAQLLGTVAASGAFDGYEPPAIVPADPEHPGPVRFEGGSGHCCWANYMVSPTTHNADCVTAEKARAIYGEQHEEEERRWSAEQAVERATKEPTQ